MKPQKTSQVYVVKVNGRSVVAFEAVSRREADELRKEQWFRDELLSLRSEKNQIWDGKVPLTVGGAAREEIVEFRNAQTVASNKQTDGMLLAYLIPLDGPA